MKTHKLKKIHNEKLIIILFLLFSGCFCQLVIAEGPEYFLEKKYAEKIAQNIVNKHKGNYCEKTQTKWYLIDSRPARDALSLLGRPSLDVVSDSIKKNFQCKPLSSLYNVFSYYQDRKYSFVDFSSNDFHIIRNSREPNFPSNEELEKKSMEDLTEVYHKATRLYSKDAHRVIGYYLSKVNDLIQDKSVDGQIRLEAVRNTRAFMADYQPVPIAIPALIKFAMNPYIYDESNFRLSWEYGLLRRWSIDNIARNNRHTLTGLIHIALIDSIERKYGLSDVGSYISHALSPAAQVDESILESFLEEPGLVEDRIIASIAESLGKSGDRGYRKLLLPLLNNADKNVYYSAACALARLGDDSGFELIKKQLNEYKIGDSEYDEVIASLGKLGNDESCKLLCEQLSLHIKTQGNRVPGNILKAIGETCNNSVIEQLLQIKDDSGKVNDYALDAIGLVADKKAIPILAKHLDGKDTEMSVQIAKLILKLMKLNIKENEDPISAVKGLLEKN